MSQYVVELRQRDDIAQLLNNLNLENYASDLDKAGVGDKRVVLANIVKELQEVCFLRIVLVISSLLLNFSMLTSSLS